MLKIKQNLPYELPAPVEPALEANEAAASNSKHQVKRKADAVAAVDPTPNVVRIPAGSVPPLQLATTIPRKTQITDAQVKREFVRTIQLENQNFDVQARNENVILPPTSGAGSRIEANSGGNGAVLKARYEIPDDYITRTAAKIIGNRKELEMREFLASRKMRGNASSSAHECNDTKAMPTVDPSGERRQSPSDE